MKKSLFCILFLCFFLTFCNIFKLSAQFRKQAFTQTYVDSKDKSVSDSTDKLFSFKEFFRGVGHKQPLKIGTMFAGSTVFIGCEQIYNKDYWKLPIIYGGLATTIGLGIHYRKTNENLSNYLFAGAGLIYWGTLMDGVISYKSDASHHPGKATLYSILLPGLGQAYNGEYWKIPIYWAGLASSIHFVALNHSNYIKYKNIHNEATNKSSGTPYNGPISAETALYYRNAYRRLRDYSIVALAAVYLLQVIDANVFAYMQDFEVGDNISMSISPSVIAPETRYALQPMGMTGIGLKLGINF